MRTIIAFLLASLSICMAQTPVGIWKNSITTNPDPSFVISNAVSGLNSGKYYDVSVAVDSFCNGDYYQSGDPNLDNTNNLVAVGFGMPEVTNTIYFGRFFHNDKCVIVTDYYDKANFYLLNSLTGEALYKTSTNNIGTTNLWTVVDGTPPAGYIVYGKNKFFYTNSNCYIFGDPINGMACCCDLNNGKGYYYCIYDNWYISTSEPAFSWHFLQFLPSSGDPLLHGGDFLRAVLVVEVVPQRIAVAPGEPLVFHVVLGDVEWVVHTDVVLAVVLLPSVLHNAVQDGAHVAVEALRVGKHQHLGAEILGDLHAPQAELASLLRRVEDVVTLGQAMLQVVLLVVESSPSQDVILEFRNIEPSGLPVLFHSAPPWIILVHRVS